MNVVPLTVETGRATGKGPSRRLRAEGKLPGTVYGLDSEPTSIVIERSELRRALTTAAGVNALLEIAYEDQHQYALVKEIQRHPVRRDPIHVDLLRIDPETPIALSVPIVLTGEAKRVTSNGGIIEQVLQQLAVLVRPDAIPNQFVARITDLDIDDVVTVEDLTLPDGVTTDIDLGTPVVTATLTRAAMVAARAARAEEAGEEFIDTDAEAPAAESA